MNYVQSQRERRHVFEYGGDTPAAAVEQTWRKYVLPHYYAPATRQRALEAIVPLAIALEVELNRIS